MADVFASIPMKTPRATGAREAGFVFRIAYCVTTERNTEYAIRTMAELLNVGLTIFSPPTIILFSKQAPRAAARRYR